MNRSLITVLTLVAVTACSEDPAPSGGSTASSSTSSTSSSGSSGTSSSTSSSSGGGPTGTTVIEATFSKTNGGYDGSTDAFKGAPGKGRTDVKETNISFVSESENATLRRTITVALGGITPAAGKTYTIGQTGDDLFNGNRMLYDEHAVATDTGPSANCGGTVTFDSITGKVYKFTFSGACTALSGSKGGFSIAGTGTGTAL